MAATKPLPEPAGFDSLSKAEQIRYLQDLWDRIAQVPGDVPVPESHIRLVEARLDEVRRDPGQLRSAYEILDRLARPQDR